MSRSPSKNHRIEVLIDIGDRGRPRRVERRDRPTARRAPRSLRHSRQAGERASIRAASNRGDVRPVTASTLQPLNAAIRPPRLQVAVVVDPSEVGRRRSAEIDPLVRIVNGLNRQPARRCACARVTDARAAAARQTCTPVVLLEHSGGGCKEKAGTPNTRPPWPQPSALSRLLRPGLKPWSAPGATEAQRPKP